MTSDSLVLSKDGAIATITLNRPDALNALSRELISDLIATFRALSDDDDLRAIILTGAGRAFSCGVDLKELSQSEEVKSHFEWHGDDSLFDVVRACPHPLITAVNGYAITGGMEVAMMADFMIASDAAVFADTHSRVGITPSWGMTQVLPRLIGINRARQMSLTGEFVDAQTALSWGLVNEVVPADRLLDRARELAGQIAETDRSTMSRIRGLIADSAETSLTEGLARETEVFDGHMSQVSPENVAAGREKVTQRGRQIAGNAGT